MKTRIALLIAAVVLGIVLQSGCLEQFTGEQYSNQPPEVWLSSGPPEGSVNSYFIHMFWGGWDPDGEITHYQYVITDNPAEGLAINGALFASFEGDSLWKNLAGNDSSFVFSADLPADSTDPSWIAEFRRTHTFFLRAVDDDGAHTRNNRIAYRSFTARTLSPEINVIIPSITRPGNPALVPPITTFRWTARDFIDDIKRTQAPDSVRWILVPLINNDFDETVDYIRYAPSSEWTSVSEKWPTGWFPFDLPGDSGKFAVSPTLDIGGNYVFAAQAKDEAGAVTPQFDENHNVRRLLAARRTSGPSLTVYNRFIGNVASSSISKPAVIFDMPAGIPLEFTWRATAEHYGGIVSGYRYGWDIVDLSEDEDWEVDFTPFIGSEATSPVRTFYFATHTFHVEVIDNSGFKSRVGIRINIIPFTMNKELLLVDDFPNGDKSIYQTLGAVPNDEELDAFWLDLLADVEGFNPAVDVIEVDRGSTLPIGTLAQYKSIIWDVYGWHSYTKLNTPTMLYQLIHFRKAEESAEGSGKIAPNLLSLYLAAGGHLLLCGFQPMTMNLNRTYFRPQIRFPVINLYEAGGDQDGTYRDGPIGENSFSYKEFCIDVLDVAFSTVLNRTEHCPVAKRFPATDAMREVILDDTNDYDGYMFPQTISLNSLVTQPGWAYDGKGFEPEIYNPEYFISCDTVLVTYGNSPRDCIEPIFRQQTMNQSSVINNGIVGIWTSMFANVEPPNGMPARSALWGFEPYYFDRDQVKQALDVILFGEWKLSPKL